MKKEKIAAALLITGSVLLGGCQTSKGLYHWGEYEESLYEYYKNPAELAALTEAMQKAIQDGNGKVPPGLYAEYGNLLLQQGKTEEAISYFKKERDLWPESQHLMDTMISSLSSSQKSKNEQVN
ncbi:MAG: DUF4810 domain-containing protein [Endozoicomonas sp.]|uniref:DUF4810 domain-containing protein n=1 Tax=Endozoicomonas sp. TaxID=1892382 RepID=UPI003D9B5668